METIIYVISVLFIISAVNSLPTPNGPLSRNILESPHITVSKGSSEGLDIANKIAELFRNENRPIKTDFPSRGKLETTKITSSAKGTSINFNFNVAVDVSDGSINRIRLPHGDLMLLFVAADSLNRVNVNAVDFQEFLTQTIGTTHMAKIVGNRNEKSSGIAFMSWAKLDNVVNNDKTSSRRHVERMGSNKKQRINAAGMHDHITNNNDIRKEWNNGVVPKFPFYHGINTLDDSVGSNYRKVDDEEDPIFSNSGGIYPNLGIHSFNNGITKTKECTTKNGISTCKDNSETSRPCQGFAIGGNCNGQNTAIDNNTRKSSESAKNKFQMGHSSNPNQRFGLNRIKPPRLQNRVDEYRDQNRFSTLPTITSSKVTTTASPQGSVETTTSMSPELQEMHDHIMSMDAHDLRDAVMDPMMLAMGTIMAMSGAYIAMVMAESSAANALALGAFNG